MADQRIHSAAFYRPKGVVSNVSPVLSPGDLVQAWNVAIRKAGIIEQRRGYVTFGAPGISYYGLIQFGTAIWAFSSAGELIAIGSWSGTSSTAGTGAFKLVDNGEQSNPGTVYTRGFGMNGNAYIATHTSVWTRLGGGPKVAGIAAAINPLFLGLASGSGFLANNSGVAYRIVWGYTDSSGNVIQGPPSGRSVYYNTSGGAQNIGLSIPIPSPIAKDITLNSTVYNMYIYRTVATAAGTGLSSIPDPGDTMNLVYQTTVSAIPIANMVVYTDILPDGFTKGPDLYTNAGQGGAANANYMPPACEDCTDYRGVALYSKTRTPALIEMTMLGIPDQYTISGCSVSGGNSVTLTLTGAPNLTLESIQTAVNGDIISVTGNAGANINGDYVITNVTATTVTYTTGGGSVAGAGGLCMIANIRPRTIPTPTGFFPCVYASYANQTTFGNSGAGGVGFAFAQRYAFMVSTAGTLAQNIAITTQNLATAINASNGGNTGVANFVIATPGDSAIDPPGLITIMSSYDAWNSATNNYPQEDLLLVRSNTTYGSTKWYPSIVSLNGSAGIAVARLAYSKTYEPESVPLNSTFDIGDASIPIKRIISNRDSVFIFKDDGLYRLGGDPNLGAVPVRFDNNVLLLGRNLVTLLNNKIYAVTTRGVCAISDYGVEWISGPIQDKMRTVIDLSSSGDVGIKAQNCIASERDGNVYFYMQFQNTVTDKTVNSFSWCYNVNTQTWTETDPTGPHQYPGICTHLNGVDASVILAHSIYRHFWTPTSNGVGQEIIRENIVLNTDDPQLLTQINGMPIPGDGYLMTVTAASGGQVTLTSLNSWGQTAAVGDVLCQTVSGVGYAWRVTGVSPITISPMGNAPANMSTIGTAVGTWYTLGTAMLIKPFSSVVEWSEFDDGEVAVFKHWLSATILLGMRSTADATSIGFYTELSGSQASPTTASIVGRKLAQRVFIPNAAGSSMQRSRKLSVIFTHSQAGKYFFIEGISYDMLKNAIARETE